MIAIIPAAGKGTRMATVTNGKPKELLRLGRKTVLQRVIEEAQEAGAAEIDVVSSPEKPEVTNAALSLGARVVLQEHPLGLADAVNACAAQDETLILFADCAFWGGSPLSRMAELVRRGIEGCIAVETVSDEDVHLYGIVEVDERSGGIRRILEKPSPSETDSRLAVSARMAFSSRFMAFLDTYMAEFPPADKEVSLTPVLMQAISAGFDFKAVAVQPGQQRIDCGEPDSYRSAIYMDWDD